VHAHDSHGYQTKAALPTENAKHQMQFNIHVAHLLGANRITRLVPALGIHELHATLDCAACDP